MPRQSDTADETGQRLKKILHGAFNGPPTPLKEIPTEKGKARLVGERAHRRLARQRKKRAA